VNAPRHSPEAAEAPKAAARASESSPAAVPNGRTEAVGLGQLKALAGSGVKLGGIAKLLGIVPDEFDAGTATMSLTTGPDMSNPAGIVHGGVAATLLDSAMVFAVHTTLGPGESCATLDLNVHYTRAVALDAGRLEANATVLHRGRRIATVEGRITDSGGHLIAHGTASCMIVESPIAGRAP